MEPCVLSELRRETNPDAQRALTLWARYTRALESSPRNRRFLARAYARARDRALGLWTPWRGSGLGPAS
jgi:hypothetical protein